MKRLRAAVDKAIMYGLVGAIVAICVVQVLFVLPDEIRWRREVRRCR